MSQNQIATEHRCKHVNSSRKLSPNSTTHTKRMMPQKIMFRQVKISKSSHQATTTTTKHQPHSVLHNNDRATDIDISLRNRRTRTKRIADGIDAYTILSPRHLAQVMSPILIIILLCFTFFSSPVQCQTGPLRTDPNSNANSEIDTLASEYHYQILRRREGASNPTPNAGTQSITIPASITAAVRAATANDNYEASASSTIDMTTRHDESLGLSEAEEDEQLVASGGQLKAFDYHSNMPVITKRELANAIKQATANVNKLHDSIEPDMLASGRVLDSGSATSQSPDATGSLAGWLASSMFHKVAPDFSVMNQTRQALISEETTRLLAKQYKLNRVQTLRGLPLISVDQTSLGKLCPRASRTFSCFAGKYRSLSGHCNNVQNPDWASAQTPLVRYAAPRYADTIARPVKSAATSTHRHANKLPSARAVSGALHRASSVGQVTTTAAGGSQSDPSGSSVRNVAPGVQHSHMTTMMSFFGQFVFHDLAQVSQYSSQAAPFKCCNVPQKDRHPECMPIELDGYCLDYVRSNPAVRSGCNLGARDQLNLVSSFLDGSAIYGSSETQMRRLRTFTGGRLRSQRVPISSATAASSGQTTHQPTGAALELLPQIDLAKINGNDSMAPDAFWLATADECRRMARLRRKFTGDNPEVVRCFQAGDSRVNSNIGLTLMHTFWMREHNYIADRLAHINRHWQDERLFEEARRIVVAELQHITFNEFLPAILSDEVMQRFNLTIQSQGYSENYDPQLNAAISNEIATAVFPFILSTIPSVLERYSDRLEMLGSTSLASTFLDASDLFKRNKFAQYLTGMISQSAMEPVLGVMPMTMALLNSGGSTTATAAAAAGDINNINNINFNPSDFNSTDPPQVDIVALTIQQGRDHGLKSYIYWRRMCQIKPDVRNWSDLRQVMPSSVVDNLEQIYASVEQLDLYLALLEQPSPGASVGPTFVCLLSRQFYHLKHGDRYWFENDLPGVSFTPAQLEEIRQTSLAKVMCRNSQSSISFIQPSPMLASDPYLNAYQYCTNRAMTDLDLGKWRQAVTSAQQVADEQLMNELMSASWNLANQLGGHEASLRRGKRLIESQAELINKNIERARHRIDSVARSEKQQLARHRAKRQLVGSNGHNSQQQQQQQHSHAGYRYLPRLKRQALKINNQSLIFELATNEVIRSLVRQGKDREQAQSLQNDIRDFLFSLETIQLDNLIENSGSSSSLNQFITGAGGAFLTEEQRARLAAANDPTLSSETSLALGSLNPPGTAQSLSRSSSVSTNCQDDDRAFPCDHTTPFRTITGWCNNLNNPKFGQSFTQLDRMLPSAYEDGLSRPRRLSVVLASTQNGNRLLLPSPRLISTTMHDDKSNLHVRYSLALMQFGQFGVDHDLTRTPFSVALDGSLLDCSDCDSRKTVHRDCLPIEVPDNDAHFRSQRARELTGAGKKCLHFVRSLNGQAGLGPRQQINALTAYLDGSNIYGSDNCEAKSLRSFVGGRLNSSAYPASVAQQAQLDYIPREILPVTLANPECVTPSGFCFHAGDQRASEQPGLTAFHTVFMRLHNTIVGQLASINRHWSDEKLYQHGRRIVAAIMQRITYNEFAPRVLGLDYMSKFDLILKNVGYSDQYDETCSASILNEFAAAAFRMGHSLIRGAFPLLGRDYKPVGKAFQLRKAFFNSQRILSEPALLDSIIRGVVSTPIETLDNSVTEELTNHLFEKPKEPFSGMDLISLNIQRARDHGIPGYNRYRVKCNLTRARNFDDLSGEIPARLIKRLSSLYSSVDDIDLFTGGMSETPVHGGIIGPTFGCIIGTQLSRLKRCDRFWHETSDPWVRFSAAQLAEIRKMTLAKVLCSQSDTITSIQKHAMDLSDQFLNPRITCTSLPSMDLSVWRENLKSCLVHKIKLDLGQTKRINPCKSCTCTVEGPVCRTTKIDCLQMMKQSSNSLNQIMADKSCLVQCAWAIDMQSAHAAA